MGYQCRKRRDCCGQHTVDFKLGFSEVLALGARAVVGSLALAAWIVGCGLVRTVFVRFVRITGHLWLSVANTQAVWATTIFL